MIKMPLYKYLYKYMCRGVSEVGRVVSRVGLSCLGVGLSCRRVGWSCLGVELSCLELGWSSLGVGLSCPWAELSAHPCTTSEILKTDIKTKTMRFKEGYMDSIQ